MSSQSVASSSDEKLEFIKKSLKVQYDLAVRVKTLTGKPIYVFDASGTFKEAETVVFEKIRVLKTKGDKYGVLSESAQFAFKSSDEYKKFCENTLNSDEVGLYI